MKRLLAFTAALEAATGLGLLIVPSTISGVLLGATIDSTVAATIARIAGAALLALGVACWLASFDPQSCATRGVVSAMLLYNLGAAIILGASGIQPGRAGIGLWPAVILHVTMTVWCVSSLLAKQNQESPAP